MHVAIIGAGFSGLLAAYLLEKNNISVTIYEKEENIGGHCHTLTSNNNYMELGTICSFTDHIKELLIDLKIDYSTHFLYRNFVDSNFINTEHMTQSEVKQLMIDLEIFKKVVTKYPKSLSSINFDYIDEDLLLPFKDFIYKHNILSIGKFLQPFISSFGFGSIDSVQTYYILRSFNTEIINAFLNGDRLLFFNKGTSEIIYKLSENISDIRYNLGVNNIEHFGKKVKVDTIYSSDIFDKVLITTKLPRDVIKDKLYNKLMKKIETNPFISCTYEIADSESLTTYFKDNQGKIGKTQYFRISKQNNRITLVAYAYGVVNKDIIDGMTKDIETLNIKILHLITVKQWYIFPHLKSINLTNSFYQDINKHQKVSNIRMIGSLVSIPSIDNLYLSVRDSIVKIIEENK